MSKEDVIFRCKKRKVAFWLGCKEATGTPESACGRETFEATGEEWKGDSKWKNSKV